MNSFYSRPEARTWNAPAAHSHAAEFHRSLAEYSPTRLIPLPGLAGELRVNEVYVKDESARMGLPAFKVLGASWACRQVLEHHPGAVLVTATDGNHGRAVARIARQMGTAAEIFVPRVMTNEAIAAIESEGANVSVVDGDYDQTVAHAAEFADRHEGYALVQDTAWEGYHQVPRWIVEGYHTMLAEIDTELAEPPSAVVVPVGVGSLAQAVVEHYRQPDQPHPTVLSVEPDTAACALASLLQGAPVSVSTSHTVMEGLNCGTVSSLAWPVLRDGCDAAVAVSDSAAIQASRDLARLGVSSGPCGAATLAGARTALATTGIREACELGTESTLILLSTEGLQRDLPWSVS